MAGRLARTQKERHRAGRTRNDGIEAPPRSFAPSLGARSVTKLVLIVVALYFLVPVFWMVVAATKLDSQLSTTFGFWFSGMHLDESYQALDSWTHGLFWRWVANSLLYAGTAALVGTLLSVMAGYAVAKFAFPGKRIVMGAVMAGLLLPVALLTIPLYTVFHSLGLTNTIWAVIVPSMVSPFGVFLGSVYAQTSVPDEVLEAARIDGAGEARIFFGIVLRLLAPAMVTIFLFIFVATWNNFLLPLMMISSAELKPVTLGMYGMMSYFAPNRPAVMLGSLLGVIPLIVLFFGLQKYWRAGLAAGSVKG